VAADLLGFDMTFVLRLESKGNTGRRGAVWEIPPAVVLLLEQPKAAKAQYEHIHGYAPVI
jgi:hypothetical protein